MENRPPQRAAAGRPEEDDWLEATVQFVQVSEEDRLAFLAECMAQGAVGSAEPPSPPPAPPDEAPVCQACGTTSKQNVYFPGSMGIEPVLGVLERQISLFLRRVPDFGARVLQCRRIRRQAWATDWMRDFPPERVGNRLWTVPPWEEGAELPPGALPILVEPGLAFGTGKHATTRHCLLFLEEVASDRGRLPGPFLDAGCGSGILSIAACLLGARRVLALEIDRDAVRAARENLARNGLAGRVRLVNGPVECCRGRFGLIAANLTAPALRGYARLLASLLERDGLCILAGMLLREKPDLLRLFQGEGLDPLQEKVDDDEGWCSLLLRKT